LVLEFVTTPLIAPSSAAFAVWGASRTAADKATAPLLMASVSGTESEERKSERARITMECSFSDRPACGVGAPLQAPWMRSRV
jgi:hypothetical protein